VIDITGQTALVTGGAKRLGAEIETALATDGVHVVIHYNESAEEAMALANKLRNHNVEISCLKGSLSSTADTRLFFETVLQKAGPIDILVNNASIFPEAQLLSFSDQDLQENIQINALSPLLLARAFAAQERPGNIINMLDCRIVDYDKEHIPYHLSKRMLFSLTRMLAIELAPRIRVNAVAPGLVLPPVDKTHDDIEAMRHTNPLNRTGSAADVAEAVLFLLRSDFVTGQNVFIDGGRHMKGNMYG
jgi:NAD(P)-dependent dehydrogenase (short-subunit alcohol dehydrogenase family)